MMSHDFFTFPQIIGYIAVVIYIVGYLHRNDNHMKLIFSFSDLFWIAHYYLISAHTAALTTVLITARNLFSLNPHTISPGRKQAIFWISTVLLILSGIVTWAGWISLIPVTTTIAVTFAMLYMSGIRLRVVFFAVDIAWMVHACVVGSFGGFAYASGALLANGYIMWRLKRESHVGI